MKNIENEEMEHWIDAIEQYHKRFAEKCQEFYRKLPSKKEQDLFIKVVTKEDR